MSPEVGTPIENSPQPFFEGSQTDTSPQLTQAETEKGGMVGPGQENLVEAFAREQEEAQNEEAILGKFKSPQELAKAYAELQRKMGEQEASPTTGLMLSLTLLRLRLRATPPIRRLRSMAKRLLRRLQAKVSTWPI